MTLNEYQSDLKKINEHLKIIPHPVNTDMAGIYWKEIFITGIPSKNIYPDVKKEYTNDYGIPHKTTEVATAQVKAWLLEIENEIALDNELKLL